MTYPKSNKTFLDPETFKCTKCGQCCRPIVKLSKEDISRIEQSGWKKKNFLEFDPMLDDPKEKDTIKQIEGVCMFLYRKGEKYFCKIYDYRPETCRKYPFFTDVKDLKDCRPRRWQYWEDIKELVKEH